VAQANELDLDITGEVCPLTLVRVRLALDQVAPGGLLRVKLAGGEVVAAIPRTLRDEGHAVVSVERVGEAFTVVFRRKA